MPSAVRLREDYSAEASGVGGAVRRTSTRADGSCRWLRSGMGSAAKIGGMDRQTLRDPCATGSIASSGSGPQGLIDNWTEGPKPRLSAEQMAQFAQIVEAGPDREKDGGGGWRRIDLKWVIAERFGVAFHERYVGKLLRNSASHERTAASPGAGRTDRCLKKKISRAESSSHLEGLAERRRSRSLRTRPGSARRTGRFGSGWARRGTRPRQPADQRYDTPICSARSAQRAAWAPPRACPTPTPT